MKTPLPSPPRFRALCVQVRRPWLGLAGLGFLGACVLLMSCQTAAPAGGTGTGASLERDPVAFGRIAGWEDVMAGRSQNHERHLRRLDPKADEDDFEEAYDDAYEAGEEEMEQFEDGRERERQDERGAEYGRGHSDGRSSPAPPPSRDSGYAPSAGFDPIPGPGKSSSSSSNSKYGPAGSSGGGTGLVTVDHSYEAGHDVGKSDRRQGLSQNARRHAGATSGPKDSTQAWIRGYEAGWNGK